MSDVAGGNPHANDPDRGAIWEMLMRRDIEAYARQDWSMVEGDFIPEGFFGVDGGRDRDVDNWRPGFPNLETYRQSWLEQAALTAAEADPDNLVEDLLVASSLAQIDIKDGLAVAHKKFDGHYRLRDGGKSGALHWQTLYFCRKTQAGWKIVGFAGYLPYKLADAPNGK